jgi:hypothetical protein
MFFFQPRYSVILKSCFLKDKLPLLEKLTYAFNTIKFPNASQNQSQSNLNMIFSLKRDRSYK